jgi:hypothetical protein
MDGRNPVAGQVMVYQRSNRATRDGQSSGHRHPTYDSLMFLRPHGNEAVESCMVEFMAVVKIIQAFFFCFLKSYVHPTTKKESGSHAFGARFRKQDACRLASLALRLSVRRFHGLSHLLFLFSAGGGHATVASSFFSVWLHALSVHIIKNICKYSVLCCM